MRVVCINDYFRQKTDATFDHIKHPVKGVVYTVRDIIEEGFYLRQKERCFRFVEIVNPYVNLNRVDFGEPLWPVSCFRPLDEKRIDVFRKLLTPIKSKVS